MENTAETQRSVQVKSWKWRASGYRTNENKSRPKKKPVRVKDRRYPADRRAFLGSYLDQLIRYAGTV